jgi:hypothetical protein
MEIEKHESLSITGDKIALTSRRLGTFNYNRRISNISFWVRHCSIKAPPTLINSKFHSSRSSGGPFMHFMPVTRPIKAERSAERVPRHRGINGPGTRAVTAPTFLRFAFSCVRVRVHFGLGVLIVASIVSHSDPKINLKRRVDSNLHAACFRTLTYRHIRLSV